MSNDDEMCFHFTDTLRLPWIIEAGELRPGLNRVSKLPYDFLWATIDPAGDPTCSAQGTPQVRECYRRGLMQLVRFTLPGEAFSEWCDVSRLYPEWTSEQVARTEQLARERHGETRCNKWRIRRDPFPIEQIIVVKAKSYTSGRWKPIDATVFLMELVNLSDVENGRGVIIDEKIYASQKIIMSNGPVGYVPLGVALADRLKAVGRTR
jgi:hypothetical protein